jgi:hypothetical protein
MAASRRKCPDRNNKSHRLPIGIVDGKQAFATLSQLRNIDSKRLVKKIVHFNADILAAIKKEASRFPFPVFACHLPRFRGASLSAICTKNHTPQS